MFGFPLSRMLIAGAILGLLSLGLLPALDTDSVARFSLETTNPTISIANSFVVDIILTSTEPINVFKGVLHFDSEALTISSIDYNVSLADLWAEEPWYNNGNGTLTFTGGTTRAGGFIGSARVIRVTFIGTKLGETHLTMDGVRVLRHDGLGSDVAVAAPLDTLFTITPAELALKATPLSIDAGEEKKLYIAADTPDTDLNNDGKHSISDVSIFMTHITTQNLRSDFNQDGVVDLTDLSILNRE